MIQAAVSSRSFDGIGRTWFFYHQDFPLVPLLIETIFAEFSLGDVSALPAKRESILDAPKRMGQAKRVSPFSLKDREGQSLRCLMADAWETDYPPHQPCE